MFWERIKKLVAIAVPSCKTKEMFYIVVLSGLLVIRTYLSIWLADVNGHIVKSIVTLDFNMFLRRVFALMLFAIPSSTVNSAMDYYSKLLATSFRERLTGSFHEKYLQNMFVRKTSKEQALCCLQQMCRKI